MHHDQIYVWDIFVISAEITPIQNYSTLIEWQVTPRFHLIYDLCDTNAPITEIVYIIK